MEKREEKQVGPHPKIRIDHTWTDYHLL